MRHKEFPPCCAARREHAIEYVCFLRCLLDRGHFSCLHQGLLVCCPFWPVPFIPVLDILRQDFPTIRYSACPPCDLCFNHFNLLVQYFCVGACFLRIVCSVHQCFFSLQQIVTILPHLSHNICQKRKEPCRNWKIFFSNYGMVSCLKTY